MTIAAFFTASLLFAEMTMPFYSSGFSVEGFLFVMIISEGFENLLAIRPSAMAVPRLPPPIIAMLCFIS
jgi:hypothetical protein